MTEQDEMSTTSGKKVQDKKEEDKITEYGEGEDKYRIGDTVYIESQRPDVPYYICSIKDFKRSKKDQITVDVIWFYRPYEIPTSVYQLLLQDRNAENGSTEKILDNLVVKERELFISDAVDIFPASSLRGHANCCPFNDIKENVMEYISGEDNWYYLLRYNPESRRMANAKGEIRIGASHQATLPTCITYDKRSAEDIKKLEEVCMEELIWDPCSINESKLVVYFRAAHSITSFNGFCNNQENGPCVIDKGLNTVSEDLPIQYKHDVLHKNGYDISAALKDIIAHPTPKITCLPFTEDERKKFMRGLRSYGKTFHKIRKELLPDRTTGELIQYYYFWKKTPIACNSRPHKRGGRKNNVLHRKTRTTKQKTTETSEFLELSSCSENEYNDSDDSEHTRDRSLYACRHCYSTKSQNWHHGGKNKVLLCYDCRIYFKRYGQMRPLKEDEKRDPPPYIYKNYLGSIEEQQPYTGRMRTRRSATPVFCVGTTGRNRSSQEIKHSNRKQTTTPLQTTRDNTEETEVKTSPSKRKTARGDGSEEASKGAKKQRVERTESDDVDDADDESDRDSESSNRSDSNNQGSTESSRSHSPASNSIPYNESKSKPAQQQQPTQGVSVSEEQQKQDSQQHHLKPIITTDRIELPNYDSNSFVPIKEEPTDGAIQHHNLQQNQHEEYLQELKKYGMEPDVPFSPEVEENLERLEKEMLEKINKHFEHRGTDPNNSCSRCERIYVNVRQKKVKNTDVEKRPDEHSHNRTIEKETHFNNKRRESGSPIHQPAQITSHYESSMIRLMQQHQQHHLMQQHYFPHEHLGHRATSPRDIRELREQSQQQQRDPREPYFAPEQAIKYYMGMERHPTDHHRSPHASIVSPHASIVSHPTHPTHPFTPRPNEIGSSRDFRISQQNGRGNHLPHVPPSSIESALSRTHPTSERGLPIDRPLIETPHSASSTIQPHLHSHLHTHTHLHVHPDEATGKYRGSTTPNETTHLDLHERANMHTGASIPVQQHRPASRGGGRDIYEHQILARELHARESMNRHLAREVRESHGPPMPHREGAVSPSYHHESQQIPDAIDYYYWIRTHGRPGKAPSRHGPGQAPDLSPRGLPPNVRQTLEFRDGHMSAEKIATTSHQSERERIAIEREREKLALLREHPEKIVMLREHDALKLKNERLLKDHAFRSGAAVEEGHPGYHPSHFMDVRRMQEQQRSAQYERQIHDPSVLSLHERDRLERERIAQMERSNPLALHERYLRAHERNFHERQLQERSPHERLVLERLHERVPHERLPPHERPPTHERPPHERPPTHERPPHERPMYSHYKPETIDLSGD